MLTCTAFTSGYGWSDFEVIVCEKRRLTGFKVQYRIDRFYPSIMIRMSQDHSRINICYALRMTTLPSTSLV